MIIDRQKKTVQLTRRDMMKRTFAVAGALAVGKTLGEGVGEAATPAFIKGADVSYLQQMEAEGYKFKNNQGQEEDCLAILKGFGINAIRLRTWVNPSADPGGGHCSQAETIAMAVRCRNAGLPCMIDFHFGDTWNGVGNQDPPKAWAKFDFGQMKNAVGNYVQGFMEAMSYNKVTPGWVQLGNEINSGLLHPIGELSRSPMQMSGLLMVAYGAVKSVYPNVPTILHFASLQWLSGIYAVLDPYVEYGGKWDITGVSAYGVGTDVPGLVANMSLIQSRYGKKVMQVEFGGPVSNPALTKESLEAYVTGVRNIGGLGVFYWEPEVYAAFNPHDVCGAWNETSEEPTAALTGFEV